MEEVLILSYRQTTILQVIPYFTEFRAIQLIFETENAFHNFVKSALYRAGQEMRRCVSSTMFFFDFSDYILAVFITSPSSSAREEEITSA